MILRRDQPAIHRPVPAPARFTDLRQHLHTAGIDAAYFSLTLEQYLSIPDNLPEQDLFLDPHVDHRTWALREALQTFCDMIRDKPDEGNGDAD